MKKQNFAFFYNHGHNTLRLFGTLPNFLFITSETKRDIIKGIIYKLFHNLPNNLENEKILGKSQKFIEL